MKIVNGKCSVCSKETRQKCSQCRALFVCSRECFKEVWRNHKPDCTDIQQLKAMLNEIGYKSPIPKSIPYVVEGATLEFRQDLIRKWNAVWDKYGVTEPPTKTSDTMEPSKIDRTLFGDYGAV